ncbi:hypothetical protein U0070_000822, partial [Myodes glareolus]
MRVPEVQMLNLGFTSHTFYRNASEEETLKPRMDTEDRQTGFQHALLSSGEKRSTKGQKAKSTGDITRTGFLFGRFASVQTAKAVVNAFDNSINPRSLGTTLHFGPSLRPKAKTLKIQRQNKGEEAALFCCSQPQSLAPSSEVGCMMILPSAPSQVSLLPGLGAPPAPIQILCHITRSQKGPCLEMTREWENPQPCLEMNQSQKGPCLEMTQEWENSHPCLEMTRPSLSGNDPGANFLSENDPGPAKPLSENDPGGLRTSVSTSENTCQYQNPKSVDRSKTKAAIARQTRQNDRDKETRDKRQRVLPH